LSAHKYFFGNRICDIWNSLPSSVVEASSLDCFKRLLNQIDLLQFAVLLWLCACIFCFWSYVSDYLPFKCAVICSLNYASLLWYCWLGGRKGIRPVKIWGDGGGRHCLVLMGWRPDGWSVCLPLLIFPCIMKSRSSLLAPAHPGGPGKRAVKRLWCIQVTDLVADGSVASCNLAYHALVSQIPLRYPGLWPGLRPASSLVPDRPNCRSLQVCDLVADLQRAGVCDEVCDLHSVMECRLFWTQVGWTKRRRCGSNYFDHLFITSNSISWKFRTASVIISANEDVFVVCLLATLRWNFWTDLHKSFREGWQWVNEQTKLNFGGDPDHHLDRPIQGLFFQSLLEDMVSD